MTESPDDPIRVLVIDDNELDRKLVEILLRSSDQPAIRVTRVAICYQEGRQALDADDWDVALIDHYLTDGTGLHLVREATAAGEQRPLILLTGAVEDGIDEAVIRAGGQDFIPKDGLERDRLIRTIQYACYRQEAGRLRTELSAMADAYRGLRHHLGVLGHELRTPLGAIGLNAELNMRRTEGRIREAFESIHRQAQELGMLAENLLENARREELSAAADWGEVDLAEVVAGVHALLLPLIDDGRLELCCEVDPVAETLRGDRAGIHRLLVNLVSNAIRHSEQGTVHIRAKTRRNRHDQLWAHLEVADQGRGIAPENLPRLGEPFAFSSGLGGAQYSAGTGLGLLVCRQIVTQHAGSLHVASQPAVGTTCIALLRGDLPEAPLIGDLIPIVAVGSQPAEASSHFAAE